MVDIRAGAIGQPGFAASRALHLTLLALWCLLLFAFVSIGHISADDQMYIAAARDWLALGTPLPESHWAVRHTVTLPITLSFALFGDGEWQSVLPSTLYAVALAGTVYLMVRRYLGALAAALGTAVFATTGLFAELGTIIHPDTPEALFLLLGLFLFYEAAVTHKGDLRRLFAAGLLMGLAFVTRETAAAVPLALGILFLAGAYTERWRYLIVGAGFLAPVLIEVLYYVAIGAGPLHRFETVLASHGAPALSVAGEVGAGTGNVTDNRFLAPFAALLLNNEFMLVFWGAIVAAIAALRSGALQRGAAFGFVRLLLLATAVWILFQFYALGLRPLPRYLVFPLFVAAFLVGAWLAGMAARPDRRALAGIAIAALVGANLFGIDLSNKAPRKPERLLAEWAAARDEPIYTSDEFEGRAANFLIWAGVGEDAVRTEPPRPGALYAMRLVTRGQSGLHAAESGGPDLADAEVVFAWEGEWTTTGRVAVLLGLDGVLRGTPLARLLRYGEPVRLYRLPGTSDG